MSEKIPYRANVVVTYSFEFESDKKTRRELEDEAEDIWNQFTDTGLEGEKYEDTEIRVSIP